MIIKKANSLNGVINVSGDKSISHRAIMLGAIANGKTKITNFLMGEDCMSTIECFRKMGVKINIEKDTVIVEGVGLNGLKQPQTELYTGNSGTTTRLLCGILSGQDFETKINGDNSIQKRPMKRIITPLEKMGAIIQSKNGFCPLKIHKKENLTGIEYTLPVASAQIKSAVLLAGLYAKGNTTVIEPVSSRDHTERMLKALGVDIIKDNNKIILSPPPVLNAKNIIIPSDISSAAFFIVAGCIIPNSQITIKNVGINPTRTGIIDILKQMGANITQTNYKNDVEPVCDIIVKSSELNGVTISGDIIPRLIDEIPILTVAAVFAKGQTIIKDAQELKVKESNRIYAMTTELKKAGADITETEDGMIINGGNLLKGASFETYNDHRIAMSMAIFSLACDGESEILNPEIAKISYPEFFDVLQKLGGL